MKLKSSVVAIDAKAGKSQFSKSVPAIGRNPLDTVFHALLLTAGIALSVAAAAQAALDSRSDGTDHAQIAAGRRSEIGRVAERTPSQSTPSVRTPRRPQQSKS